MVTAQVTRWLARTAAVGGGCDAMFGAVISPALTWWALILYVYDYVCNHVDSNALQCDLCIIVLTIVFPKYLRQAERGQNLIENGEGSGNRQTLAVACGPWRLRKQI